MWGRIKFNEQMKYQHNNDHNNNGKMDFLINRWQKKNKDRPIGIYLSKQKTKKKYDNPSLYFVLFKVYICSKCAQQNIGNNKLSTNIFLAVCRWKNNIRLNRSNQITVFFADVYRRGNQIQNIFFLFQLYFLLYFNFARVQCCIVVFLCLFADLLNFNLK